MAHKAEAIRLFNETWDLLDKPDRTPEDDILMLHKAHTSCFLWRTENSPLHNARGEWQVARVYSVLGYGAPALLHAQHSLAICTANQIGGFDLAFGYEAVARAFAVLQDESNKEANKKLALQAAEAISDEQDQQYTLEQINSIQ